MVMKRRWKEYQEKVIRANFTKEAADALINGAKFPSNWSAADESNLDSCLREAAKQQQKDSKSQS